MEGSVKHDGGYKYDLTVAGADYPAWHGTPRRTIVVCTQQRSGSTLLGEAIYFATGLGCPLEYFHPGFMPAFQKRWAAANFRDYVAHLHRWRTDPSGVFSVKIFWRDIVDLVGELTPHDFNLLRRTDASRTDDAAYRRILATISEFLPEPTFIFLRRNDEIRQAISTSVAAQTGLWRRFPGAERRHNTASVVYDFHSIVQWLAEIQNCNAHWRNFFRANDLTFHEIHYEDLAGDYEAVLRRMFVAIGCPDAPIHPPRMQKQAGGRSDEWLRQFKAEFHHRARG